MSEDYKLIQQLANYDVAVLEEKGRTYGDSWRKRGGVGAFMMLSRKWDRIENIALGAGYDIFKAGADNTGDILDDIADLRRYLLLVEAHVAGAAPKEEGPQKWTLRQGADPNNPKAGDWVKKEEEDCGPGPGYVNQDGPVLPWRVPEASKPVTGTFDVIQVMWHDGTYSVMLPHEFGKIAEWSEVKLYRVIMDGTDPDEFPLPSPVRQWDGGRYGTSSAGAHTHSASGPTGAPHAGDHQHTINVGHYLDGPAQPPYSHTTLAGIASAVSGVNIALGGAAASINS